MNKLSIVVFPWISHKEPPVELENVADKKWYEVTQET